LSLRAFVQNIQEAEAATAQLDAAFKATGENARVTRSQLDELASSIQRTTIYGDDLVKQAESILLTFRAVRGDAFERTIRVATDLSARLGIDLVTAVRQVGRAVNDPIQGLTALRRAGIQFSDSQERLINNLTEAGHITQAQNVILKELESNYRGAAVAARNTLGGAIAGLKNAFGDLFEGTKESTSDVARSLNRISAALSDPKIKEGIDELISGLSRIVELATKAAGSLGNALGGARSGGLFGTQRDKLQNQLEILQEARNSIPIFFNFGYIDDTGVVLGPDELDKKIKELQAQIASLDRGGRKIRGGRGFGADRKSASDESSIMPISLEEVRIVNAARIALTEYQQLLADLTESTETDAEKQISAYRRLREELKLLKDEGVITEDVRQKRLDEGLDDLLPEFDLDKIRGLKKEVKREVSEIGEFMKGVWQGVGQSIQATLSDALYEWKFSFRSLLDITRRALADITSAIITSGISKALKDAFSGTSSSSSGGFWVGILKALGFAAGGGTQSGPRIVGEDGPELVMDSSRVYNRRQMAFAGMGANVNFHPVTNITLIERDDPERTKREIFETVAIQNARQQAEFIRTLQRSGVEVKG